jgi:1,4-alpha-glucan branching enzyme
LRQVSNVGSDLRDGREFLAVTSLALKDSGALQNLDKLSISERFDFVSKSVNQLGIDRKCSTAEFLNGDANYNRRVLYFLKNYIDHNASNYSVLLNQSRSTAEKGYRVPFLAKTTYPLWYKSASLLFGNSFYNVPAYSGEEESFLA